MSMRRPSGTEHSRSERILKPIRSEKDYEGALARIQELWEAPHGSPESDEMEILAILVEAYEKDAHPIPPPHPIDALRFAMEQRGLERKDLESILGGSGRVSEILKLKRPLTLPMIRRLHKEVGLNPTIAIREYEIGGAARTKKRPAPPKSSKRQPSASKVRNPGRTRASRDV